MRVKTSFFCFSLVHGTLFSILIDVIKIIISGLLLIVFLTTGNDERGDMNTIMIDLP